MKISLSAKSLLLTAAFVFSSCATTKYNDDVSLNNYSNLLSGRSYTFKLKNSKVGQRMIFTDVQNDSIIGYVSKKDSSRIALAKTNVMEVKDNRKANTAIAGGVIGVLGVAAIVVSASRAD